MTPRLGGESEARRLPEIGFSMIYGRCGFSERLEPCWTAMTEDDWAIFYRIFGKQLVRSVAVATKTGRPESPAALSGGVRPLELTIWKRFWRLMAEPAKSLRPFSSRSSQLQLSESAHLVQMFEGARQAVELGRGGKRGARRSGARPFA